MTLKGRTLLLGIVAGLSGAAIAGLGVIAFDALEVYPLRNIGIDVPFALVSTFLCALLGFLLYAHSDFLAGWFFGGLAGSVAGAFTGIGFLLSYDQLTPVCLEFVSPGFVGAMIGAVIGAIMGAIFGPVLARFARREA
jgi:hypothetical protein